MFQGRRLGGELDKPLLDIFVQFDSHETWFENNPKFRKRKALEFVMALDPLATLLPQEVQEAQAAEWQGLKDYFNPVSHHRRSTTRDEMEAMIAALGRFLYDRLAPVVAKSHLEIQKFIAEGEADGN